MALFFDHKRFVHITEATEISLFE